MGARPLTAAPLTAGRVRVRPIDPRLLRHAAAARPYVLLTAGLGVATAGLVVGQALLLAHVITHGASAALGGLAAIVGFRALAAWAQERTGHRAATAVVGQLRTTVLEHAAASGATGPDGTPGLATLLTRGLDGLDGYLTRYLPQLLLAGTVTPATLAVICWQDPLSALTAALALPLIPLFMVLVGLSTRSLAQRRLRTLQRLGGQLLDLVAGLPTLRAFGREQGQVARVREAGEGYRRATMGTLRSAFLSALVLESLTTLAVALVAVGIGLRLVYGRLELEPGLAVLILVPEVFLPLRMVGVHYHASVDGLAAAGEAFAALDRPARRSRGLPAPDLRTATIRLVGVSVLHRGRAGQDRLDLTLRPGQITALAGPNGSGKSSAVAVLLGLRAPDAGRVLVEGPDGTLDLTDIDPATWWAQLAWVPQRPVIVAGTLRDNATIGGPVSDPVLEAAAGRAGLSAVLDALPGRWQTRIGQGGVGLSAGQRQRLALTRALLRPVPLVLLDEPTAHLDAGTEQAVLDTIAALRARGAGVLLVAHRPALLRLADTVVDLAVTPGPVTR